jgi:cystathionine gamma-synthase
MLKGAHVTEEKCSWGPATIAVKGGISAETGEGVSPPIHLSSTYVLEGDPGPGIPSYARAGSPAFGPIERAVADLEQASEGVAFNAGMAAAIAILEELKQGEALVMPDDAYYGIRVFAEQTLCGRGIEVRLVTSQDLDAVDHALDGAAFLWTETPTNPLVAVSDLAALGALAKKHGIPWACDNTFATPILQRPIEHGAVAVMHSATKYIGGHSDLLMGMVATTDSDLAARLRARRNTFGTQPDGFTCWLARRGLQTMPLRIRHQSAAALELATRAKRHPNVDQVYYPGLPGTPDFEIASRQMDGGFGAILSILVKGGAPAAQRVVETCEVWTPATSLGSVESLIERRARWAGETADPALLRLSVGLEEVEDLWRDLDRALKTASN